MNNGQRGSEWTVVLALGLIALGVWFLLGNLLGPWWHAAIGYAFRVLWPIVLIVLGILLWASTVRGQAPASGRRLYRSRTDRRVSGVLGGLAEYLGLDPTLVRAVYLVIALLSGVWPAVAIYIVAAIIVPEEPVSAAAPQPPIPGTQPVPPVYAPPPPPPPAPVPPVTPPTPAAPADNDSAQS